MSPDVVPEISSEAYVSAQLAKAHHVVISTSGGKDSQATLEVMARLLKAYPDLGVTVVHADLGEVEWPGTRELAEVQATAYGWPLVVVKNERRGLLDQVLERRKWPDAARRWYTSDHKRAPIRKVITALSKRWRADKKEGRMLVLNVMGFRAQESRARAKRKAVAFNKPASCGDRTVLDCLPIHDWSEDRVWESIKAGGVPHHPAYDAGMPRLSCSFCILASKSALVRAAQLRPDLAARYVEIEAEIGHTFKQKQPISEIVKIAKANPAPFQASSWEG